MWNEGINFEILQSLGIKNSANIAVLLSAQEEMKKSVPKELEDKANTSKPQGKEVMSKVFEVEDSSMSYDTWASVVPIGTSSQLVPNVAFGSPEARRRLEQRLEKFKLKKTSGFSYDRHCLFSSFAVKPTPTLINWLKKKPETNIFFFESDSTIRHWRVFTHPKASITMAFTESGMAVGREIHIWISWSLLGGILQIGCK